MNVAFLAPRSLGRTAHFCGGSLLNRSRRLSLASVSPVVVACLPTWAVAAPPDTPPRPNLHDQLDALFNKRAYPVKSIQLAWQKEGEFYTILEPAAGGKGQDIVSYDTASGKRS